VLPLVLRLLLQDQRRMMAMAATACFASTAPSFTKSLWRHRARGGKLTVGAAGVALRLRL